MVLDALFILTRDARVAREIFRRQAY